MWDMKTGEKSYNQECIKSIKALNSKTMKTLSQECELSQDGEFPLKEELKICLTKIFTFTTCFKNV